LFDLLCVHSGYTKSPSVPLRVPEVPSPEASDAKDTRGFWVVTMGCFSHLSPVKLTRASSTGNSQHPPVTPEIRMGSVPLHPAGTRVHCAPVPTKALYCEGLMSQTIKSTQSSVPGHPFPPPGRRLGPSILVPGQSIHCLTLAVPDQKSPHQDQGR